MKASVKISINDNLIDRISPFIDEIIEYNNNKLTAQLNLNEKNLKVDNTMETLLQLSIVDSHALTSYLLNCL